MANGRHYEASEWVEFELEGEVESQTQEGFWDSQQVWQRLRELLERERYRDELEEAQEAFAERANTVVNRWVEDNFPTEEARDWLYEQSRFESYDDIAYNTWNVFTEPGVGFWEDLNSEQWESLKRTVSQDEKLKQDQDALVHTMDGLVGRALRGGTVVFEEPDGVLNICINPEDFDLNGQQKYDTLWVFKTEVDAEPAEQYLLVWAPSGRGSQAHALRTLVEWYDETDLEEVTAHWFHVWLEPGEVDDRLAEAAEEDEDLADRVRDEGMTEQDYLDISVAFAEIQGTFHFLDLEEVTITQAKVTDLRYGLAGWYSLLDQEGTNPPPKGYGVELLWDARPALKKSAQALGLKSYYIRETKSLILLFNQDEIEAYLVWQDQMLSQGYEGVSFVVPARAAYWTGRLGILRTSPSSVVVGDVETKPLRNRLLR